MFLSNRAVGSVVGFEVAEGRGRGGLGSDVHWETQGHLELATGGTTTVRGSSACVLSSLPNCLGLLPTAGDQSVGRSTVHSSSSSPQASDPPARGSALKRCAVSPPLVTDDSTGSGSKYGNLSIGIDSWRRTYEILAIAKVV